MRWWVFVVVLSLAGCQVPLPAEAAGDDTAPRPAAAGDVPGPRRSRADIMADTRRLERLAALSDGCKLNQRIVIAIVTRVGAALFVGGLQQGATAADRDKALTAGADDARRARSAGRAPTCDQVGAELLAMARENGLGVMRRRDPASGGG